VDLRDESFTISIQIVLWTEFQYIMNSI